MLSKAEIITLRSGSKNNCLKSQGSGLFHTLHRADIYGESLMYLIFDSGLPSTIPAPEVLIEDRGLITDKLITYDKFKGQY
ncbi:hypothetical protein CKY12_11315 [Photorhabdus sp. S12-55]|nr:hypothetical protein A4R40_01390 [Photorhabdus laumondii subsp. laumondii]AXG41103.1 hypothetical protein PluDJC_01510 [Photorhabdus laumondii subsp. laumondii]RAW84912.1 hypothetical protein CKY12_11315 [Photorhabdus sp. S12-55]RAW85029.1 hypothetical protein CKY09_11055 [Photorhabdus sp. S5P8-50]